MILEQDTQELDFFEIDTQSMTKMVERLSPSTTGYLYATKPGISQSLPETSEQRGLLRDRLTRWPSDQPYFINALYRREAEAKNRPSQQSVHSIIRHFQEALGHNKTQAVEQEWLSKNRERYGGQWIALAGDKLLANSRSSAEVIEIAKAEHPRPLVVFIEANEIPFAGW